MPRYRKLTPEAIAAKLRFEQLPKDQSLGVMLFSRSGSGMSRYYVVLVAYDDGSGRIEDWSRNVAALIGGRQPYRGRDTVRVRGCGFSGPQHLIEELNRVLGSTFGYQEV